MHALVTLIAAVILLSQMETVRPETVESTPALQVSAAAPLAAAAQLHVSPGSVASIPQPVIGAPAVGSPAAPETWPGGVAASMADTDGHRTMAAPRRPETIAPSVPEPAAWMAPLAGLIVAAFIALHKLCNLPPWRA